MSRSASFPKTHRDTAKRTGRVLFRLQFDGRHADPSTCAMEVLGFTDAYGVDEILALHERLKDRNKSPSSYAPTSREIADENIMLKRLLSKIARGSASNKQERTINLHPEEWSHIDSFKSWRPPADTSDAPKGDIASDELS